MCVVKNILNVQNLYKFVLFMANDPTYKPIVLIKGYIYIPRTYNQICFVGSQI